MAKKYTADSFVKTGGLPTQFLKADGSTDSNSYASSISPAFTGTPTAPTIKLTNLANTYIPYHSSTLGLINSSLSVNAGTVTADGVFDVVGDFKSRSNLQLLNKAGTDWLTFADRNTTSSEAVYDLSRIGNLTINNTATLNGKIQQTYTALATDTFYDGFLSNYSSSYSGYNYHAIRTGSGTGGAIGAANNSTGTGSAIVANRYAGGQGNGIEGSKVGPEAGDGVFGINSGGGTGNGTSGIISGGGSGHAIYGENVNGSGYAGYFLGGKGVRIISATDSGSDFSLIVGGATTKGLVVNGNGNVGVGGVLFPSEKLEVNGNISSSGAIKAGAPVRLKGYTVATLPAGTIGDTAYVTDASGFSYNSILVGGGSGVTMAFFDGTNWRAH